MSLSAGLRDTASLLMTHFFTLSPTRVGESHTTLRNTFYCNLWPFIVFLGEWQIMAFIHFNTGISVETSGNIKL